MDKALANADLRNLFIAAKRYSARSVVVELGTVADAFASRYAELDHAGKEGLRTEYPGTCGRKYAYGWMGQWARLVDCDPEAAGDTALSARTMVRYLKFLPVASELVRRERVDAVPTKLGGTCSALSRALARVDPAHGPSPSPSDRTRLVSAVADAYITVSDALDRPINASAAHAAALNSAILSACEACGAELGPAPDASSARKPKKRGRAGGDIGSVKLEQQGLDARIAVLVSDEDIAREVAKRLEAMIPDIARNVERDIASAQGSDCEDGSPVMRSEHMLLDQAPMAASASAANPAIPELTQLFRGGSAASPDAGSFGGGEGDGEGSLEPTGDDGGLDEGTGDDAPGGDGDGDEAESAPSMSSTPS